jgi:hypothetical protein
MQFRWLAAGLAAAALLPAQNGGAQALDPAARIDQKAQAAAEERDLRAEAREIVRQMLATGQMSVTVDALVYPYVQELIAEEGERSDSAYQAEQARFRAEVAAQEAANAAEARRHEEEMARWRATVEENERKMAEWRTEACRIDRSKCAAE